MTDGSERKERLRDRPRTFSTKGAANPRSAVFGGGIYPEPRLALRFVSVCGAREALKEKQSGEPLQRGDEKSDVPLILFPLSSFPLIKVGGSIVAETFSVCQDMGSEGAERNVSRSSLSILQPSNIPAPSPSPLSHSFVFSPAKPPSFARSYLFPPLRSDAHHPRQVCLSLGSSSSCFSSQLPLSRQAPSSPKSTSARPRSLLITVHLASEEEECVLRFRFAFSERFVVTHLTRELSVSLDSSHHCVYASPAYGDPSTYIICYSDAVVST